MNTAKRPTLTAWVRDQYGRVGRVTAIHHGCPESKAWIAGQQIPVTREQLDDYWVSVLLDGGGSVVQPIGTLTVMEVSPGQRLDNTWTDFYFGEEP